MRVINLGLGQEVWKAFKEKSRLIVHLHIAVVRTLRKSLITMWHRRCAKFILDKTSFRISVLWKHWHFELHVWSIRAQCWPDSESGRETILASDSSSEFARSENRPGINYTGTQVTQWDLQNKGTCTSPARLSFVSKVPLRNMRPSVIYSVPCDRIVQRAHCWRWLSLILWSSDKNRVVLCSCEGFGMKPVFLRPFTNAPIIYLPGQRSSIFNLY